MNLWWIWVRRSYVPFFLPFGVVIAALSRFAEPTQDFRYEWLWASADAGSWLVFGGAVIVGASAWEAWLTRKRTAAFESSQPAANAGRIMVWAGAVVWWLAFHALVVAGHLAAAATSGAIGSVSWLHLTAQFGGIAGWCALGVALGWSIRSPLVAPVLSVVVALLHPIRLPDVSFDTLVWFGMARSTLGLTFEPSVMVLKLLVFGSMTLLVVATARRRWHGRAASAIGVVAIAVLAVPVLTPRVDLRMVPVASHVCAETSVEVCGIPEPGSQFYESLAAELAAINSQVVRWGVQPPRSYRVFGPDGPEDSEPGVGWIVLSAESVRRGVDPVVLVEAAVLPRSCGDPREEHWQDVVMAREAVLGWALLELEIGGFTVAGEDGAEPYPADLVAAIRREAPETQHRWFAETYRKVWQCDESGFSSPDQMRELH